MAIRGRSQAKEAKQASQARTGGGRGDTWKFYLDDGEEALVIFRGRFEGDFGPNCEQIFGDDSPPNTLAGFDQEELAELAIEMGCTIREDYDEEKLRETIMRRVDVEMEPVLQVTHYAERNKSAKKAFLNCGDPEAAAFATEFTFETKCAICKARQEGDKGVSTNKNYTWSVWDLRVKHRVKTKSKDANAKDEYVSCAGKFCRLCKQNALIDSRDQDDIKSEDVKKLMDSGYSPKYVGGLRLMELNEGNLALIDALEDQIRTTMCRACGDASLEVTGAQCGACANELDVSELVNSGWDPNKVYQSLVIECPHCEEHIKPEHVYECPCGDPTPARLGDVRVKVRKDQTAPKKYVWSFQVLGKAVPLNMDDNADILAVPLPDYEKVCRVPSKDEQAVYLDPSALRSVRNAPAAASMRGKPVAENPPPVSKVRIATGFKRQG